MVRIHVLRKDNYTCQICKTKKKKTEMDIDHIIPKGKGIEPFNKNNLRVLCKKCQRQRQDLENDKDYWTIVVVFLLAKDC